MITPTTSGYKTFGFWATLAVTVYAAISAAGVIPTVTDSAAQAIVAALAAAGYTGFRSFRKGDSSKPAWKTTEFWLSVAAALTAALIASGIFRQGGTASNLLAWVATALAAVGYGVGRTAGNVGRL